MRGMFTALALNSQTGFELPYTPEYLHDDHPNLYTLRRYLVPSFKFYGYWKLHMIVGEMVQLCYEYSVLGFTYCCPQSVSTA